MKEQSFSAKQKADIIDTPNKNTCCRRAFMDGIISAKGIQDKDFVSLAVENDNTADYISALMTEIYSHSPEKAVSQKGGRQKILILKSNSAVKYISKIESTTTFLDLCRQKCKSCHSWFWKGVFLASGRISNPEKQICLEFSLGERASLFKMLFEEQGLAGGVSRRRGETVVYFKNNSAIQDFFGLAGMNNTFFSIIEFSMKNESRNYANRISNCETHNITRAVDASQKHINAIQDLDEANLITSLSDELTRTARLRIEYPDLSLAQLSAISTPPITKSGLSHRLNKILTIAEQKLGKKY